MAFISVISRARSACTRFGLADSGNIAVIFAIALVPILGFVGAAVDYTRANSARSSMQAALDSTALMLSKDLSPGNHHDFADFRESHRLFQRALYQQRRQVGFGQRDLYSQQRFHGL